MKEGGLFVECNQFLGEGRGGTCLLGRVRKYNPPHSVRSSKSSESLRISIAAEDWPRH